MNRLIHFFELRARHLPVRLCWKMSGLFLYEAQIKRLFSLLICTVAVLYLMSSTANAITTAASNQSAAKISSQQAEIEMLRKIVASCVSDKGGAIQIGDEWFYCGINSLGKF